MCKREHKNIVEPNLAGSQKPCIPTKQVRPSVYLLLSRHLLLLFLSCCLFFFLDLLLHILTCCSLASVCVVLCFQLYLSVGASVLFIWLCTARRTNEGKLKKKKKSNNKKRKQMRANQDEQRQWNKGDWQGKILRKEEKMWKGGLSFSGSGRSIQVGKSFLSGLLWSKMGWIKKMPLVALIFACPTSCVGTGFLRKSLLVSV